MDKVHLLIGILDLDSVVWVGVSQGLDKRGGTVMGQVGDTFLCNGVKHDKTKEGGCLIAQLEDSLNTQI